MAQTRAADSLPSASVVLDPAAVDRTASPLEDASELSRGTTLLLLLLLGGIGAVILIASGGGNDSPG